MVHPATSIDGALDTFGLDSFRPGQREVIESIVSGNDCMCIMPTGGGKSLCYQLPSVIRSGLTIVVSPLIALMKDQVDSLAKRGISAALINSTLSQGEQSERLQAVASGKYQMVYVSPERLRNGRFIEAIRATPIQLLAVDEAHCISQWGHDFRPDYTRIGQFRELLGGVQTVALTATATPRVRDDIVQVLQLERPKQFMSGFARPNLHFGVLTLQNDRDKEQQLEAFFQGETGSGIIYSATRKRCEALVELLTNKLKISGVGAYHAGLLPDQRRMVQERFMRNELKIIIATNAFGMGIDKPDLRFVIHYNMPGSLEAYYQEAGRAGRDGKQSQCVMLYSFQDRHIQEFFIDNNYPERATIQQVYEFLHAREEDPIELTLEEIRDALGLSGSPEVIGSCLQILARTRVLDRLEMGSGLAMVRIDSRLHTLVDLLPREAKVQRTVLRALERSVGQKRGEEVYFHPRWLLQETGLQRDAVSRALRALVKLEDIDYVPPFRGRAVHFRRRDVPFDKLEIDFENLRKRKDAEYDRLNQVVSYSQTPLCRQAAILRYFGDRSADNCERCDRCNRKPGWPEFSLPAESESNAAGTEQTLEPVRAQAKPAPSAPLPILETVVDSIQRIHGRLGKHLLAQYLCGSKNAKVQKLNLHRLSGFGVLEGFRQADGVELIESLLSAGVLRQQEVNRNRPTVSVAPELMDQGQRREIMAGVQLSKKLLAKLPRGTSEDVSQKTTGFAVQARQEVSAPSPVAAGSATPQASHAPQPSQRDDSGIRPESSKETAVASLNKPHLSPALEGRQESQADSPPGELFSDSTDVSSDQTPSLAQESSPNVADWSWTLWLFSLDRSWQEVMTIRRMTDEQLAANLCEALAASKKIEPKWLIPPTGDIRSKGQQRVYREIRRRASAGVS